MTDFNQAISQYIKDNGEIINLAADTINKAIMFANDYSADALYYRDGTLYKGDIPAENFSEFVTHDDLPDIGDMSAYIKEEDLQLVMQEQDITITNGGIYKNDELLYDLNQLVSDIDLSNELKKYMTTAEVDATIQLMIDNTAANYLTEAQVRDLVAQNTADQLTEEQVNEIVSRALEVAGTSIVPLGDFQTDQLRQDTALQSHIDGDLLRWQQSLDANVKLRADMMAYAQNLYSGTVPVYDYTIPQKIYGTGGLVNLLNGDSYTVPQNGAIVCEVGGLLGLAVVVQVNGNTVWTSPVMLLGAQISGDTNPSSEIQVSTGDIVTTTGVLGVGQVLDITFYPNKM